MWILLCLVNTKLVQKIIIVMYMYFLYCNMQLHDSPEFEPLCCQGIKTLELTESVSY